MADHPDPAPDSDPRQRLLAAVRALAEQRLAADTAARFLPFLSAYLASAPLPDLQRFSAEDLYGALLAHWHLGRERRPGQPLLRVYNPSLAEDGWECSHTVVEVVCDDMPFLVDSLSMALNRQERRIHLVLHPVLAVRRSRGGVLRGLAAADEADALREAWLHFEVDRDTDPGRLQALHDQLLEVLRDVQVVVADWQPMRQRMQAVIAELAARRDALPVPEEEVEEVLAFLRWLDADHFTYIGYRAFDLVVESDGEYLVPVADSPLGIFRRRASRPRLKLPSHLLEQVHARELLVLTKSTLRSTVHRPAQLDYVGIKRWGDDGRLLGEWRFQGLYASTAYDAPPQEIPLLRRKVAQVLARAGYRPGSHAGKALAHILNIMPRDEMFQATADELYDMATGILHTLGRQELRVFLRHDPWGRFVSALVVVPRDHYDTGLRQRMTDILQTACAGQGTEFNVQFTESGQALVHFIVRTEPGNRRRCDAAELERRMSEAMLTWRDRLQQELLEKFGEARGLPLFQRYADAFPPGYQADFAPRLAVLDIQRLERIDDDHPLALLLFRPPEDPHQLRLKLFGRDRAEPLSSVLPRLERMGLKVLTASPYAVHTAAGDYWIIDFHIVPSGTVDIDITEVRERFQTAFAKVCARQMESDRFNALVLEAGLDWREVTLLRAIAKYLLQTGIPFSQSYMEEALTANPHIAAQLIRLFRARFDPGDTGNPSLQQELVAQCEKQIDQVRSLDEDRILRRFLGVLQAMLRTNYYQTDAAGEPLDRLSFKLDPARVPGLPEPRPRYEIYVYAVHTEGVHLRGGKVARGGIRWSDRKEDFRTEVLGLMKAQMVKNALIVPVGAKGGFIVKRPPASGGRDALQAEVQRCYGSFIRGLLDLTDNRVDGRVAPPPDVVRYDDDDPYLVVAADKGTARFSDLANAIAAEYGFWLGDAFASGGSHGYDHKEMGITARGVWEAVKRHFRELGTDIQSTPFTVVGIGDMSGDVFGNGMLLSEQIRLVGAFNHLHIFLDPDPDPAASFAERQRLFALPRSTWMDYDRDVLSAGGGIYSRFAKSIPVGPEVRRALGLADDVTQLTPDEMIRALLRAPVDLLYNGGIGTYIKARSERHSDVGDRANDAVRIDATELRCRVVGEGGNLGFTQLARIEYARHGGRINTDAIDNSAGVDCSDHEVNIKILLDHVVAAGDMTEKQRNALLAEMTDEVAALVLRHNYGQTQSISITADQAHYFLLDHQRLLHQLEQEGRLQRRLEFLPDDAELARRHKEQAGLTRPEIAVLMAYGKIRLYHQLLDSELAGADDMRGEFREYFPPTLRKRFHERLPDHFLRAEITATHLTNQVVDRMGASFTHRMEEETGAPVADIVRCFLAARALYDVPALWADIEALDNRVPAAVQIELFVETRRLLERATRWLLRQIPPPIDIDAVVARFAPVARAVAAHLRQRLAGNGEGDAAERLARWREAGVPAGLAETVAGLDGLAAALDMALVSEASQVPLAVVIALYFRVGDELGLDWLVQQVRRLPRTDHWTRSVRTALRDEIGTARRAITRQLTAQPACPRQADAGLDDCIAAWRERKGKELDHFATLRSEILASTEINLAMLTVAVRQLSAIAQGDGPET